MKAFLRALFAALLLGAFGAAAEEPAVETYELHGNDPKAVMAALEPVLKPESRVSHLAGALVVVADAQDQAIVREVLAKLPEVKPAAEAAPTPTPRASLLRQYKITIVQGASRADVERLTSGGGGSYQSSRSTRSGPQTTSLRVVAGKPARIETGRMIQAVDAVFMSRGGYGDGWGGDGGIGVSRRERPVTRGFSVTATPHGGRVKVEIESFIAREGRDDPGNRQLQNAKTSLLVSEGEWVEVGGGGESPDRAAKTYGSRARLEESTLLLRVDRVRP